MPTQNRLPADVDLCADFRIPGGPSLELLRSTRVPEHFKYNGYETGSKLETFYINQKDSPLMGRIYDKGLEVGRDGSKLCFLNIWGIESLVDIWRVEFQFRRNILKRFKINSLEELEANLHGLWNYATENWFSLRDRSQNRNATRCPFIPF